MVIEQDADQHANRIGAVEFLQEGNELAAAMALGDGVVDNAGHEADGCREGHSSKPFVFMVALDSRMLPGLGRQIGAVVAIAWIPGFSSQERIATGRSVSGGARIISAAAYTSMTSALRSSNAGSRRSK
jgi:hypothetical protein